MKKLLTSTFLLLTCSMPAQAYYYMTCDGDKVDWEGTNSKTLRAHTISFEQDPMRNALDRQIARFNFNPSKFRLDVSYGHSDVALKNEKSEIWFSTDQDVLKNRPGFTKMRFECTKFKSKMIEADVVLQGDFSKIDWTYTDDRVSLWTYEGNNSALRTTIMHEFGHVIALLHTIETYGVMGNASRTTNTNGNRARSYLGEDGSSGAVKLYGTNSSNIEDVSVSHWKFVAAGDDPHDDYSEHDRTEVYDSDIKVIEETSNKNSEIHYKVKKGQTIGVQFTYENSGQDEQSVDIGFFLSGNNTITTGDLFLRDNEITITRNSALTLIHNVTIPAWVPSGYYFVGSIIDYNKKLGEQTGSNNISYIGIRVLKDNDEI